MPFSLPPRIRFKLHRLQRDLEEWWYGIRKRAAKPEPDHRMCPSCRGLVARGETTCPLCGIQMKSAPSATPGTVAGIIPVPSTATATLMAINIGFYLLSLFLTHEASQAEFSGMPGMGGIRGDVLVSLGSQWGPIIIRNGEWWRLVTANYLHGGLIHIGFNMWVLFDIGRQVDDLFRTQKFLLIYLLAGMSGSVLSLLWNPMTNSVGASGAVLGLIGALIGASFHHGSLGKVYRASLLRWLIYIFVLGFLMPGIDNAAHVGGLAAGLALGYVLPEGEPETRTGEVLWNTLALVCVVTIAACFVLMSFSYYQGPS